MTVFQYRVEGITNGVVDEYVVFITAEYNWEEAREQLDKYYPGIKLISATLMGHSNESGENGYFSPDCKRGRKIFIGGEGGKERIIELAALLEEMQKVLKELGPRRDIPYISQFDWLPEWSNMQKAPHMEETYNGAEIPTYQALGTSEFQRLHPIGGLQHKHEDCDYWHPMARVHDKKQ